MAATRRPTVPAPMTRAVEPGVTEARLREWMATERGSRRAAASKEILLGSLGTINWELNDQFRRRTYLWHQIAGWLILSWSVPWKWGTLLALLLNLIFLQRLYLPFLQIPHWPQGIPTSSATLSPRTKPLTWGPIATTTPEDSCPRDSGAQAQRSPLANFL